MRTTGTTTMETRRLFLRRFTENDAPAAFAGWMGVPDALQFLYMQPYASEEAVREAFRKLQPMYERGDFFRWAITRKEDKALLGSIALTPGRPGDECAELGYVLGEAYRGQGYMTEAVRGVIAFGFTVLQLNRIFASHARLNPASGAVLRRAGMQYEGMTRQSYHCAMGFMDSNLYAILREDWQ